MRYTIEQHKSGAYSVMDSTKESPTHYIEFFTTENAALTFAALLNAGVPEYVAGWLIGDESEPCPVEASSWERFGT